MQRMLGKENGKGPYDLVLLVGGSTKFWEKTQSWLMLL
jgi:hypothetical protein